MQKKKENVCESRKQRSSLTASQSSKRPTQSPSLPAIQDIRAQGMDAVTSESQVAMVLKAEKRIEDFECQRITKNIQASVFCIQSTNAEIKCPPLTVRRKSRRPRTKYTSCFKPTAKDCLKVTAEGQSAVSFEIVTPEAQSRKIQRHLVVSNKRNSSPCHAGEVSDVSGVFQRGKKIYLLYKLLVSTIYHRNY